MKLTLSFLILCASGLFLGAPTDPDRGGDPTPKPMPTQQKIATFLWFDSQAEEAVRFYASIFKDSKVLSESRWGDGGPLPKGTLMTSTFRLAGQEFMALNGGPMFRFSEAISLFVRCDTQAEIDELWSKLGAGGQAQRCGWLKDKYGLSWQIVPTQLAELLNDPDPARARRVGAALMQMDKIDVQRLKDAHAGR